MMTGSARSRLMCSSTTGSLAFLWLCLLVVIRMAVCRAAQVAVDSAFLARTPVLATHIAPSEKISSSDLQHRQALLQSFQLAAFQQFRHRKTGKLYDVAGFPDTQVQAIRLRLGRFRKDGIDIHEFSVPPGCAVNPAPQRIVLVYARLASINASLFVDLPNSLNVVQPIVTLLAYDASDLNSTQALHPLSVASSTESISVQFEAPSTSITNISCASFSDNSTAVSYSAIVDDRCLVQQLGVLSRAGKDMVSNPTPAPAPTPPQPGNKKKSSRTWKIVVGSIIGGLAVLALLSLLTLGIDKHRKNAKFAVMEYQADQGETLETALVHNSRAPTAGGTRTRPGLEDDHAYVR